MDTPQTRIAAATSTRNRQPAATRLGPARLSARLRRDPQFLLGIAIAIPVVAMEGTSGLLIRWVSILYAGAFVLLQVWLTSLRATPSWFPSARLGLSLAFVAMANVWLTPADTWPLAALAIPIVALASARGRRADVAVAIAAILVMLLPVAVPGLSEASAQESLALVMAAIVVGLGSREAVASLERSSARLRQANLRDRRHARQLAAVESVGRVLAREGPTPAGLDRVTGLLEETFGYRYPSIYLWTGKVLELGAQRNYEFPIASFTPERGVIGRVVRTGEAQFLPDARSDPDFLAADPNVVSEIGIPLQSAGELLGVLNVETSGEHRLDEGDLATMKIVADRLSVALALGRERQKLTERAALLDRLTQFATVLWSNLDPTTMDEDVAKGAAEVIPADSVAIVNRDDATGRFIIHATSGGDPSVIGGAIEAGEGISGRAIAARAVVVDDRMERSRFPRAAANVNLPDALAAMAAPMLVNDEVVGCVTWLRGDLSRTFTAQEREVAALLAGKVGLAFANARLHQRTRDAAITDPLTGLHNRRHFDAAMDRDDALRRRIPAEKRAARSAILFDLDHFGRVNKRFGHQVGDRVLRLFADTLRARTRASDLVARFGGEEFAVILDNAGREDAMRIAEQVRLAFARLSVEMPSGETLTTTVSAGCSSLEPWEVEGSLLLERCDVALAMAKAGGRDQVVAA